MPFKIFTELKLDACSKNKTKKNPSYTPHKSYIDLIAANSSDIQYSVIQHVASTDISHDTLIPLPVMLFWKGRCVPMAA